MKIKESETLDKYYDPARDLKQVVNREDDGDIWCHWNCPLTSVCRGNL